MENSWQFLKKLTIAFPYDQAISFLGICAELETYVHTHTKKTLVVDVYSSIIHNSPKMKIQCPSGDELTEYGISKYGILIGNEKECNAYT